MESKVEAVLAGFSDDIVEEKDAMAAAAAAAAASPAAILAFLAHPLWLLRHVACLCAGYLGLDDGGLKPSVLAPASSLSSSAAAAVSQIDEVEAAASENCTAEVVLEVRSRGFTRPVARSVPVQSKSGEAGGAHH